MKSLWNIKDAASCKDALDLLVYRSRLIGQEPKLCVWGGGNTSTKTIQKDHRGRERKVLLIKGSGSDLKTSTRRDYPPVDLEDLQAAFDQSGMTDEAMVDYVGQCLLDTKAPRPSIEVLLHAFVDHKDIDHTHADAILSITNTKNAKKIVQEIFGDELLWVPYVKPGFTLAKWVGEAYRKAPNAKGVILEKHGLITWAEDAKTSYQLTIEMVTRAEEYLAGARRQKKNWSPETYKNLSASAKKKWLVDNLPIIRKTVSRFQPAVLHFTDNSEVMSFVNAKDAAAVSQIGPATPDHMLRTKRVPLYTEQTDIASQIENYAREHARYFNRFKKYLPNSESQKMLDPYPKVILVPGVGMITTGKDLKSARIVAEIYEHSISVMKNASTIDVYESLSEKLAFEMDYWPMELYKLSLAPKEAEFSRKIALVTGAARGIGFAIAKKLILSGAHVFLSDIHSEAIEEKVKELNQLCKEVRAFALQMDVTDEGSVRSGFEKIILTLGGLDYLVSNAGVACVSAIDSLDLEAWQKTMNVNATGHFLVSREAVRIMKRQAMGGSIVFIASKNVLAPGKDFGAYSASKAAQTQLARILAIENGAEQIRVNLVNPDGIFEDSGLWDQIREDRAKTYGIKDSELEKFYQNRNLMKTPVSGHDVAEAAAFLLSDRAKKTTGCILTVDGGVKEAFPR